MEICGKEEQERHYYMHSQPVSIQLMKTETWKKKASALNKWNNSVFPKKKTKGEKRRIKHIQLSSKGSAVAMCRPNLLASGARASLWVTWGCRCALWKVTQILPKWTRDMRRDRALWDVAFWSVDSFYRFRYPSRQKDVFLDLGSKRWQVPYCSS